ncbi:unnamed protein product, partial [Brenthis ino]
MNYILLCILIFTKYGFAVYSSKAIEGYAAGFLSDCPGSTKEAFIKQESVKYLTMFVLGNTSGFFGGLRQYGFHQMRELAKDPHIDFKKKTMLYVGGYMDIPRSPLAIFMAHAYKNIGYNVLLLSTEKFTTMEYPRASRFMRPVGKLVAQMLIDLTKEGLNPKRLEIVGISLGGQTASFIAKNFQKLTGRNVSRLTGLDPAGPCFRNLGPNDRIDKSDADFVEIISTNIDGYGMAAAVGHVTYYVNGGENQPGQIFWPLCQILCSHVRSHTLWLTALKYQNSFVAIQCDSVQEARNRDCYGKKPLVTNLMGLKADKSKEGIFYLSTSNNYPYFLGEKGTKRENDFYLSFVAKMNDMDVIEVR